MKLKCIILIMLSATALKAQHLTLKGLVVDAKSGTPIAAATISVSAKSFFYPAGNDGRFNIVSDKLKAADTVSFSCIGYQTKKITVSDMLADTTVKLEPVVNALKEVNIGYIPPKLVNIGSKRNSAFASTAILPGMQAAMFISGSDQIKGNIYKVGFYLTKGGFLALNKGDVTAPFRVRLYEAANNAPGKELTKEIIVVAAKKNNHWFDVDLSGYQIRNPDGGFFISFCLLNNEYYKDKNAQKNHTKFITSSVYIETPRLGTIKNEFKQSLSYKGTERNYGIIWHKDNNSDYSYLMRAVIDVDFEEVKDDSK